MASLYSSSSGSDTFRSASPPRQPMRTVSSPEQRRERRGASVTEGTTMDPVRAKHLPLSALNSWSQKYFDGCAMPQVPGLQELRTGLRKKRNHVFFNQVYDMVCRASDRGTDGGANSKDAMRAARMEVLRLAMDDVQGCEYVTECLLRKLKDLDAALVLGALDLLDHLMRKVPFFYRYVANRRFFDRFWGFVDPLATGKSAKVEVVQDAEVASRVLFLIRAWAEEFEPVIGPPRKLDQAALFLIAAYENRSLDLTFPDVPPGRIPYVYPIAMKGIH